MVRLYCFLPVVLILVSLFRVTVVSAGLPVVTLEEIKDTPADEEYCGANMIPDRAKEKLPEKKDEFVAFLREADKDGSMTISIKEAMTTRINPAMFSRIDANRNKELSMEEVRAWLLNRVVILIELKFKHADFDGDGVISLKEARYEFDVTPSSFKKYDLDDNGVLTKAEIFPKESLLTNALLN